MITYLYVCFGAAALALVVTPLVVRLARARGLFDYPGTRRVHQVPVPRIGGLAVAVSLLGATLPVVVLGNAIGEALRLSEGRVLALFGGAVFMLILGLWDDLRGLRPRVKLAGQVAAALGVCALGIRINEIAMGQRYVLEFGWMAWPITVLWIVGITNAVNLIDGLDGLAAGISAIACAVMAVLALHIGQPIMAVLMLALLGSLAGFLVFNFNPARIFLGDSGTMLVGFVIATASVMCASKSTALVGLALPALALGVPIFDTLFSVMRRLLERRSVFAPDRGHVHHRLMALGFRQRHAVLLMYGVTAAAAGLGLFMMGTRDVGTVAIFLCVSLLLVLVFRSVGAVRLRESLEAFRRNRTVAREARHHQLIFEEADLRAREVTSFDAWWGAVCDAARQLEFASLDMAFEDDEGQVQHLHWRHPNPPPSAATMAVSFPVRRAETDALHRLTAQVHVNGSLESTGRRVSLFGRLIDEHPPYPLAPHAPEAAPPAPRTVRKMPARGAAWRTNPRRT